MVFLFVQSNHKKYSYIGKAMTDLDLKKPPFTYHLKTKNCLSHTLLVPKFDYQHTDHSHAQGFFNQRRRPKEMNVKKILKWVATRKFQLEDWAWQENQQIDDIPQNRSEATLKDWKIWFINHATVLIQIGQYNFLTDPVWADHAGPAQGSGPKRCRLAGLALEQLPKIDAVLLSHNHYDHMDLATLDWLHQQFSMPVYTGLANGVYLPKYFKIIEMDWWQELNLADQLKIVYVPAQHGSGRGVRDQNKALWGGFSILAEGEHCYFAGDVAYSDYFKEIKQRLGAPRLALLPIGAYEPRELMQYVHMNPEEAVKAHLDLVSKQSIAIHHRTFQLTDEGMFQPEIDLNIALEQYQVEAEKFICLEEGQAFIA